VGGNHGLGDLNVTNKQNKQIISLNRKKCSIFNNYYIISLNINKLFGATLKGFPTIRKALGLRPKWTMV
jgi:hypothetical protein